MFICLKDNFQVFFKMAIEVTKRFREDSIHLINYMRERYKTFSSYRPLYDTFKAISVEERNFAVCFTIDDYLKYNYILMDLDIKTTYYKFDSIDEVIHTIEKIIGTPVKESTLKITEAHKFFPFNGEFNHDNVYKYLDKVLSPKGYQLLISRNNDILITWSTGSSFIKLAFLSHSKKFNLSVSDTSSLSEYEIKNELQLERFVSNINRVKEVITEYDQITPKRMQDLFTNINVMIHEDIGNLKFFTPYMIDCVLLKGGRPSGSIFSVETTITKKLEIVYKVKYRADEVVEHNIKHVPKTLKTLSNKYEDDLFRDDNQLITEDEFPLTEFYPRSITIYLQRMIGVNKVTNLGSSIKILTDVGIIELVLNTKQGNYNILLIDKKQGYKLRTMMTLNNTFDVMDFVRDFKLYLVLMRSHFSKSVNFLYDVVGGIYDIYSSPNERIKLITNKKTMTVTAVYDWLVLEFRYCIARNMTPVVLYHDIVDDTRKVFRTSQKKELINYVATRLYEEEKLIKT